MRRTDNYRGHNPVSAGHAVPRRSTARASGRAMSAGGMESSHGIGSQAEYEFGRIPIFPVSHGSFRSIPECTTPADMVEREVDQMARDVMQIPDGLSRQRGKQEVDGLTTASLYTLGEGAFAVSAGKNISDVLWGQ